MSDLEDKLFGSQEPRRSKEPKPVIEGAGEDLPLLDKIALATSAIPVVGDVTGGVADAAAIVENPSAKNIGFGLAGLLPFVPSGIGRLESLAGGKFKKAIDREKQGGALFPDGTIDPQSRGVIVEMDADEFLRLAKQGEDAEKTRKVTQAVAEGAEFDQLPLLQIDDITEEWKVIGHEGRHRVRAFRDAGFDKVPVKLQRTIGRGPLKKTEGKVLSQDQAEVDELLERSRRIRESIDPRKQ